MNSMMSRIDNLFQGALGWPRHPRAHQILFEYLRDLTDHSIVSGRVGVHTGYLWRVGINPAVVGIVEELA